MRITNPMISNRMMLNLNRGMRKVDGLYNQLSTGKQVIFPSDDPILAGRALKFRTNVLEVEQYQRNVGQGVSWMEISEGGFNNVNNVMSRIRELSVQGASDENRYDDRQKIVTDIQELVKQLGAEMNISYAGRYVFSGYRTEQPPLLEKDTNAIYNVTQSFMGTDIETIDALKAKKEVGGPTVLSVQKKVDMLKLAYKGNIDVDNLKVTYVNEDGTEGSSLWPTILNSIDELETVDADKLYFVKNTGEFVVGGDVKTQMLSMHKSIEVNYTKTGFLKGDINPVVYFDCEYIDPNNADNNRQYNMDNQTMQYEFGVNSLIPVNSLAKDVYTDKMYADLVKFCSSIKDIPVNTIETLTSNGMTEAAAKERLADEEDMLRQVTQTRFNNLIGLIDKHVVGVTKEHTNLGSRMSRLQLIENRLMEDRLNYKKLLSDNEDVDYMEASMDLNAAESVYQAALQTGAKIIQLTLANYIN